MIEGGAWYFWLLLAISLIWLLILLIRSSAWGFVHALVAHTIVGLGLSIAFVLPIETPPDAKNQFIAKLMTWLDQGGPVFGLAWFVLGGIAWGIARMRASR